jgi:hypothetical protein
MGRDRTHSPAAPRRRVSCSARDGESERARRWILEFVPTFHEQPFVDFISAVEEKCLHETTYGKPIVELSSASAIQERH